MPASFAAEPDEWGEEDDDFGEDESPPSKPADPDGFGDDDDDFGDGDDDFGGDNDGSEPPVDDDEPSPWSMTGFARSDWGLWVERFDDNPFAKGRQSLDLVLNYSSGPLRFVVSGHAEYDLAYLVERDSYDGPTLEAYELLVDFRKTFLALSLGDIEITVGKQIVAWGEGDAISAIDVVNPRDGREPGLADLDDLRLPVLATRIGYFTGYHRFEAMMIHEAFFGYRSPPFGPFSPLPALIAGDGGLDLAPLLAGRDVSYRDLQDRFSLDNQEVLLRWSYKGPGIDLALYGAWVLDDQGVVVLPDASSFAGTGDIEVGLDHRRFWLIGHSGAYPLQDWLFKWEAAVKLDQAFNVQRDAGGPLPELGVDTIGNFNGVLSITYAGISDTTIALEMGQTFPFETRDDLLFELDVPQIALRSSHTLLREDLRIDAAISLLGWKAQLGWLARVEANYTLMDGWKLGAGFITFQPSDSVGPFSGFDRHDRLFVKLRWDFTVF